jgi:tetratricopeptide (TPR) repeat protein
MPETARIIAFPVRQPSRGLSPEEAVLAARNYLQTPSEERTAAVASSVFSDPEILFAICKLLRDQRDLKPRNVAHEASAVYWEIQKSDQRVGVFDERDYLLGESAFLAGSCYRHLGEYEEALRWLDRAEAGFRHTVNPGPGLSNVAYTRLALRFAMGQYHDILELIPSVSSSFEKLGMPTDLAKCRLLEAMTLKQCGRMPAALEVLEQARTQQAVLNDNSLHARILAEIGDVYQLEGQFDQAMKAYETALPLLENRPPSLALADLQMFVGAGYRGQGQLIPALEALRSSLVTYAKLEMATRVSYVRLFVADTLLALGRNREAEWEILAALPAIEHGKMVPEGLAAAELLKESVRGRKTDPNALRELREHLQAGK